MLKENHKQGKSRSQRRLTLEEFNRLWSDKSEDFLTITLPEIISRLFTLPSTSEHFFNIAQEILHLGISFFRNQWVDFERNNMELEIIDDEGVDRNGPATGINGQKRTYVGFYPLEHIPDRSIITTLQTFSEVLGKIRKNIFLRRSLTLELTTQKEIEEINGEWTYKNRSLMAHQSKIKTAMQYEKEISRLQKLLKKSIERNNFLVREITRTRNRAIDLEPEINRLRSFLLYWIKVQAFLEMGYQPGKVAPKRYLQGIAAQRVFNTMNNMLPQLQRLSQNLNKFLDDFY